MSQKLIFDELPVNQVKGNVFDMLNDEWMLITSGTIESYNTMTASWGSFGILWNKPIAIIFIRPHRYTFEFVENNQIFTLSFFGKEHRDILNFCGQHSGRKVDKVKETGLVPYILPSGAITFEQARLIFECKKLYADNLKSENFIDKQIIPRLYPDKDFHKMYIGEINKCYYKIL